MSTSIQSQDIGEEWTDQILAHDELPAPTAAPTQSGRTPRQIVLLMLVVGIAATTLLAVIGVLMGESEGLGNAITSAFATTSFGVLALVGTYRRSDRLSRLAWATVATSIVGLTAAVVFIWVGNSTPTIKLAVVTFIVAFATAHAAFLQARRRDDDSGVVAHLVTVTQVFIALAATMLCIFVIAIEDIGEAFARALAIVFLIDGMFNILVPIVRRATR